MATQSTQGRACRCDTTSSPSSVPVLEDDAISSSQASSASRRSSVLDDAIHWPILEAIQPVDNDGLIDTTEHALALAGALARREITVPDIELASVISYPVSDMREIHAPDSDAERTFAMDRYLRANDSPWNALDLQSSKTASSTTRSAVLEQVADMLAFAGDAANSDLTFPTLPAGEPLAGAGAWVAEGDAVNHPPLFLDI
jgi:hypothetical protein